jgi:predicted nucleic acid-binding protein
MAVSIDTQILIWGIKKQASANRRRMIERAEQFFARCAEAKERLILPAQSMAEFLSGYSDEQRVASYEQLKNFIIAPLDAKAAAIAAKLQRDWDFLKDVAKDYGSTRQHIKADVNIIASSVAAGATMLYSNDLQMPRLAQGIIPVVELPEPSEQTSFIADP